MEESFDTTVPSPKGPFGTKLGMLIRKFNGSLVPAPPPEFHPFGSNVISPFPSTNAGANFIPSFNTGSLVEFKLSILIVEFVPATCNSC